MNRRRNKRSGGRLVMRSLILLIVAGLAWTGFIQWKIQSARNIATEHAETGIVLGAALWNDVPSPALRERLQRAIELFKDGSIEHIIVSGGLDYNGSKLTEAEGMKNYLVKEGIPAEAVVEENEARNTYENILFSKRIMDRNGWVSSIIITHDYHGARALDIAKFVGLEKPAVSTTGSKVMWMPWHYTRETLAYTKWLLLKPFLQPGSS